MYYFLSIIAGVLISILVMLNGKLSGAYGVYLATAIIHLVGFLFALLLTAIKKEPLLPPKKVPFHLYLGGAVGVLTIVFNNMAFGKISVSAILAICLLGQAVTSLVFDRYGFFGMPRSSFHKSKLSGLAIVLAGIIIMVSSHKLGAAVPIVLTLITGFTVVLSRTINAGLAQKSSIMRSTLYYYAVGFALSLVLLFAFGGAASVFTSLKVRADAVYYLGGVIGVVIIIILNATVAKISSLYMTLILFAGQVFAGVAVDVILTRTFSPANLIGGVLVTLGLSVNVLIDRRIKKKQPG